MVAYSPVIYLYILVRSRRLHYWCCSRWVSWILITCSLSLNVLVMFVIELCRLWSVILDGWTAWAISPPWSWSCFPWPTGGVVSSTFSCCLCYPCQSCRTPLLILAVESVNATIWWAIVSIGDKSIALLKQFFMMRNNRTRTDFAALDCRIHS